MARNTVCENSDGCTSAVLERLVIDPRLKRENPGPVTLSPWSGNDGNLEELTGDGDRGAGTGGQERFPAFELGEWRFTVKTLDLRLVEDLKAFCQEISGSPRADRKFTFKLIRCTEMGRLAGWAWQKERAQIA